MKTKKEKNKKSFKPKIKLSKLQIFLLIFIVAVIVLTSGAFIAISIANYKPTVAFYNVSEKVQATLEKEMEIMPTKKSAKKSKNNSDDNQPPKRNYNYIVLDNTIPLSQQKKNFKKAKIIFATLDCDVEEFATTDKLIHPQSVRLLSDMPSTTRQSAIASGENLFAVPLLYDFYELDINRPAFNESNVKNISVWDDLEEFFTDTLSENSPFSFAGGNDAEIIDFIGCLTEALEGTAKLEEAQQKLYEAAKKDDLENLEKTILELCEEGQPLYSAIEKISSLYQSKLLNPSFTDFQIRDKLFFIENHITNSTFLKLSEHRNIDSKVINEFTSIYIPGKDTSSSRTFSSPTIVGLSLSKNKYTTEALMLLATSHQSNLSFATGLAPVQANCGTPDRQADDVRFWLAASSGPNMPLSAALPSDEMKEVVAHQFKIKARY